MKSGAVCLALVACHADAPPPTTAIPPQDPVVIPETGVALPLRSLDAYAYTVAFGLGDSQFAMLVDTGSATSAVASADCADCNVTPAYSPAASGVGVGVTTSTYYEDGSGWSGDVFDDVARLPSLPAVALDFAAITEQTAFFDPTDDYQGILGLGPSQLLEQGTIGYPDRLTAGGVPHVMAFRLCPDRGDMWLGGFDPAAAAAPVQYTPLLPLDATRNPFYAIRIADIALGAASLGLAPTSFGPTVIDTGTSISYVPSRAQSALLAVLNGNAAFKSLFPNQTLADTDAGACVTHAGVTSAMVDAMLPSMTVSFPAMDGGTFAIRVPPSQSYLVGSGGGQFCWAFSSAGNETDGTTIGDTLLAGMLTVFDIEHDRVGFAPQRGCAAAAVRERPSTSRYLRPPKRR